MNKAPAVYALCTSAKLDVGTTTPSLCRRTDDAGIRNLIHRYFRKSVLVSSAIHYIEHHYPQNLTVRQLADELNVSINRLISDFRTETGKTPGSYIQHVRLSQASRLLSNTDLTIQNISTMAGIPDANYFIKLFKREYSMTPNQYRKFYRL